MNSVTRTVTNKFDGIIRQEKIMNRHPKDKKWKNNRWFTEKNMFRPLYVYTYSQLRYTQNDRIGEGSAQETELPYYFFF